VKSSATAARAGLAIVTVAIIALWASPAHAQQFNISFQMGGNTYTVESFSWGPSVASSGQGVSNELTLTLWPNFEGSVDFMNEAASKQVFATADLQNLFVFATPTPLPVVDIQMTDVVVESVRVSADNNATTAPGTPRQIVTLKFDSVVYTFQPYLPNGQRNGPPMTFSAKFKK
jgi:hypothetical protein